MAIQQFTDRPLNIYRASAGSGKTHLLTGFYLKLLFVGELLPETHSGEMHFSEILAVTFTNKATAEMKTRIIDELYLLSQRPETSDYWDDIAPSYAPDGLDTPGKRSEAARCISKKATSLLVQILNEYSSFNISTIDSFFQKIVRSFARELNIPGNYEVELDSDNVLETAVTRFLDKLNRRTSPELFQWMMQFSEKRIDEGDGWDMRDALLKLTRQAYNSETYRQYNAEIRAFTDDMERMKSYAKLVTTLQREWRDEARRLGEQGQKLMELNGLSYTDFKFNGSGNMSYFDKLAKGETNPPGARFTDVADDADKLWKKPAAVSQNVKDAFHALVQQCMAHTSGEAYCNYMSARAIGANLYQLGILASIDKEVTAYCNEKNIMLLSSTTDMLSQLIDKDDTPFIYEKTGTHIHSYMIDEFQDTSGMQWGNFKPLLSNSLAERYQNLIVGDVKQSIYRWRGGDWNLLNTEINDYEPQSHYDDASALTTNWRSLPNIVEFNNDFFTYLATELDRLINDQRIEQIFSDVKQQIAPPKRGEGKPQGLVDIQFFSPTDEEGNPIDKPKKDDYIAEASRRLPDIIIQLQQNGFRPKDIAILCRYNSECRWAAEALLKYKEEHPDSPYGMDIISGEALLLAARPAIQALIYLMQHLLDPTSDIVRAMAWTCYYQLEGCTAEEALDRYFSMDVAQRDFHPELSHRPLYEMTEELIALLPEGEPKRADAPFLMAFRDMVLEYVRTQGSNLSGFLEWWEQKGQKKSITTPEGQNAIQIMTIHKSKGLGMPAVVMPYASWELDIDNRLKGQLLWCQPHKEPFAQDVLLPIQLSKDLEQTIFCNEYKEERARVVIDNLNTAYVAFTRAKEALVIMAPKPETSKSKKDKNEKTALEDWLLKYCQQSEGEPALGLTLGNWQRAPKEEKVHAAPEAPILDVVEPLQYPKDDAPRNSLPQITILHDPERPDITAKERGNYIHAVLQEIRTRDDADRVIANAYARGEIDREVIDQGEMTTTIRHLLDMPEVKPWFQPGLQVLNELTLMDNQGNMQRPDRIVISPQGAVTVIDYKTGSSHAGYRRQVASYMNIMRQMGYSEVRGFLLFIKDEKVVEVRGRGVKGL